MAKELEKGPEEKQPDTLEQQKMSEALQKMTEAGNELGKNETHNSDSMFGGKYWTHNEAAIKKYGGHNAKVGRGRGIVREERASELGLPKGSSYEDIRVARAKQFGLPEDSKWDEINAVAKEAEAKEKNKEK